VVNGVIEQLDLAALTTAFSQEGQSSYHPKMMLKVMVYAYMDNNLLQPQNREGHAQEHQLHVALRQASGRPQHHCPI
jgi:transposase